MNMKLLWFDITVFQSVNKTDEPEKFVKVMDAFSLEQVKDGCTDLQLSGGCSGVVAAMNAEQAVQVLMAESVLYEVQVGDFIALPCTPDDTVKAPGLLRSCPAVTVAQVDAVGNILDDTRDWEWD